MTHEDAIAAILAREQEKGVVTEAELRQQLADAIHQRDMLGKAIGDAALKAGIIREDVGLTGPQLMMLADDMAECSKASEARNAQADALLNTASLTLAKWLTWKESPRLEIIRHLEQSAPATDGEGVSRVVTLSGCKFTEHELIERAVRAATGTSRRGTQRWIAMKDAFGCGSGVANALCHRFNFDPDEMVKP